MATPRSAGRVLIKPMGDYNPATTYEMLDAVEYDGSTYLCKQTSTGNLPTNKTYWQKMISVGADDFMAIDGSNANNVRIGYRPSSYNQDSTIYVSSITKDAGANQDLIMTRTVTHSTNNSTGYVETRFKMYIGLTDMIAYRENNVFVPFVIDSVATTTGTTEDTITITAHLQNDVTDAISLGSTTIYAKFFIDGDYNLVLNGKDVLGNKNLLTGDGNVIKGSNSFASGSRNVVNGDDAAAIGYGNYIGFNESFALGTSLETQNRFQVVVGKNNDNKSDTIFEIGQGGTSRRNAFEIYNDSSISCDNGDSLFRFTKNSGQHGYYDESYTFHPFQESLYLTKSVTLSTSADTTTTFSNAAITTDSMIDVYTDTFGVNPTNVVVATGTCTLTFAKVDTAQTISARIEVKNV